MKDPEISQVAPRPARRAQWRQWLPAVKLSSGKLEGSVVRLASTRPRQKLWWISFSFRSVTHRNSLEKSWLPGGFLPRVVVGRTDVRGEGAHSTALLQDDSTRSNY